MMYPAMQIVQTKGRSGDMKTGLSCNYQSISMQQGKSCSDFFSWNYIFCFSLTKDQLISKYLFCVFTFFQKANENKLTCSKVEFVRLFFARNVGLKKLFRICLTFIHSGICITPGTFGNNDDRIPLNECTPLFTP